MDDRLARFRSAVQACDDAIFSHAPVAPDEMVRRLAARSDLPSRSEWDRYGEKGPVSELEHRVGDLLGKPAAAFFPSGTMAQQCALRVWTERAGCSRVALPDLSHLLRHEGDGPRLLHGFEFVHLTTGPETVTGECLDAVAGPLAAALVELPLRDGGYQLPEWEELVAFSEACRTRGVPLHVDGARLWEVQPFYARPLAEIAGLADTVYVSFYKGLAGFSGAVLAGPDDVVEEAATWRHRMGGTLFSSYPVALAALAGLDDHLPRMGEWHARSLELAMALVAAGFRTSPARSNSFRMYAEGSAEELTERAIAFMERTRLVLTPQWHESEVPGWAFTELVIASPNLGHPVDRIVAWLLELCRP